MATPSWLRERLSDGGQIILDGATGSELERRGVPMDENAWCSPSVTTHSEVLKSIHKDYIFAGAEVLITNTFAASRQVLEPAGFGDEVRAINTAAVDIAKEAIRETGMTEIAIAGSISDFLADGMGLASKWSQPARLRATYREQSEILVEAGADLIMLEMMQEPEVAIPAIEESMKAGVDVWIGMSCRSGKDGNIALSSLRTAEKLYMYDDLNRSFDETLEAVTKYDAASIHIMHSNVDDTTLGIEALKKYWDGAIGVYPNCGYFQRPSWQFVDIIEPSIFQDYAQKWKDSGVQIIGGCCGIGPDHIEVLRGIN